MLLRTVALTMEVGDKRWLGPKATLSGRRCRHHFLSPFLSLSLSLCIISLLLLHLILDLPSLTLPSFPHPPFPSRPFVLPPVVTLQPFPFLSHSVASLSLIHMFAIVLPPVVTLQLIPFLFHSVTSLSLIHMFAILPSPAICFPFSPCQPLPPPPLFPAFSSSSRCNATAIGLLDGWHPRCQAHVTAHSTAEQAQRCQ